MGENTCQMIFIVLNSSPEHHRRQVIQLRWVKEPFSKEAQNSIDCLEEMLSFSSHLESASQRCNEISSCGSSNSCRRKDKAQAMLDADMRTPISQPVSVEVPTSAASRENNLEIPKDPLKPKPRKQNLLRPNNSSTGNKLIIPNDKCCRQNMELIQTSFIE